MKTFEFRWRDENGEFVYKTIELPDDAAMLIGIGKCNREIYEDDGVFAPDQFYPQTATIGIKPFVNQFSLAQDARERQKYLKEFNRKEYFVGDPTKEEMPPVVWFKYFGEPSAEWLKFHGKKSRR